MNFSPDASPEPAPQPDKGDAPPLQPSAKPSASKPASFAEAAQEEEPGLVSEFIEFLGESKKWWLTPIIIVLLIVGVFVLNSAIIAPFIYPLF